MTDKVVYGVTEDGTYSTTGPAVSLSGGFSSRYAIAQLFFGALADGETVTVTILHDQNNWAVYSGAQFIAGTPNSLDLSGAILKDSAGTLNDSDAVEVFSFAPPDRPAQKVETVTTADITGQINTHHVCTIAGLTAERNFILPAPVSYGTGKVADRIRVTVPDGDADYELVIKGDTGITINGGSAATEWSRLFIAGETVELEATSSTNWQVVNDGRIAQKTTLSLSTNVTTQPSSTWCAPTDYGGAWTSVIDIGQGANAATGEVTFRRSDTAFSVQARTAPVVSVTDGQVYGIHIIDPSTNPLTASVVSFGATWAYQQVSVSCVQPGTISAVSMRIRSGEANRGATNAALEVFELLP